MAYGLGVDLGTTFTAAAVCDERGTRMVALSPAVVVPSLVHVSPDGGLSTGIAAQEAAGTDPLRSVRGHKRRLGDPTPIVVGGAGYSASALLAAQLKDVVAYATEQEGMAPDSVALTCPAVWGPYRRELFDEVTRLADLRSAKIVTEPEAAATHYAEERRLGDGDLVAVYDLGGGTFDTTILRAHRDGLEIVGTPEGIERLGGIDFDETLLAHVDSELHGALSRLDPADPTCVTMLAAVRASCVQAKERLSFDTEATISVPLPGGDREVLVTRPRFESMIQPSVRLTIEAVERMVAAAALKPEDLTAVLLAGGSSRIPLVARAVAESLGVPVWEGMDPKFSVALGAATIAARGPVPGAAVPVSTGVSRRGVPRRGRVLVSVVIVAVLALASVVLVKTLNGDGGGTTAGSGPTTPTGLTTLEYFNGRATPPYRAFVASPDNWGGVEVADSGSAQLTDIATAASGPDDVPDGLRARWLGTAPGQFYVQNTAGGRNLTGYMPARTAVEFDVVVHTPPSNRVILAAHCVFPCSGGVEGTSVFAKAPAGQKITVKIPLDCFVAAGLDLSKVNTPFLVYTDGVLDATFAKIRWVPGAAEDADVTRCADLV